MPLYKWVDIMMMLRDQRFRRYQGINILLSLLDENSIEPIRRKFLIVAGLRGLGLYDIDYDKVKPKLDINFKEKKEDKKGVIVPMQLFKCHLMDAIIEFDVILN